MQDAAIKDQISEFMSHSFSGAKIAHDQDIFDAGFGNSMFAMQLVNFVEVAFEIEVDSDDLDIDNFRSIDRVAALVQRKREVAAA